MMYILFTKGGNLKIIRYILKNTGHLTLLQDGYVTLPSESLFSLMQILCGLDPLRKAYICRSEKTLFAVKDVHVYVIYIVRF